MRVEQGNLTGNAQQTAQTTQTASVGNKSPVQVKNFTDLKPGDVFKATITDIQPNQVSLRLDSGNGLTAKSLILPEARISDEAFFLVKETIKGQILLEMIKPQSGSMENNILREALTNAGLYPSGENLDIAKALIHENLPINSETLQKAAFFYYAKQNLDIDKMLFLLKENFNPIDKNLDILNRIMDKTLKLSDSLSNLVKLTLEAAAEAGDSPERAGLMDALFKSAGIDEKEASQIIAFLRNIPTNPDERKNLLNRLHTEIGQRLSVNHERNDFAKKLEGYYKALHENADKIAQLLDSASVPDELNNNIKAALNDIRDNIEFMNHIKNYKEYMQIPLYIPETDNKHRQAELYIFKNPGKKGEYSRQASVLIAMDFINLGHVEIFINKTDKQLQLQFRGSESRSLDIINNNFPSLSSSLNSMGYYISGYSVKKITEHFNITQLPESGKENEAIKRYSFDMRI